MPLLEGGLAAQEQEEEEEHVSDAEAVAAEEDSSQACFVLRSGSSAIPERASSKAGKRKQHIKPEVIPLPLCFKDEPADCGLWRLEAFQSVWEKIEECIKDVFDIANTSTFKEIQKFIRDTLFCDAQIKLYLSSKTNEVGTHSRGNKQLHAALLYLRNVDSSDHTNTFCKLKQYLERNDCHVANLLPHNFSSKSGIGGPLHSVIRQIAKINSDTTDMDILVSWHKNIENAKSPIVIMIEDAELCNSVVLADFIVILSEWITELPMVLILGMGTSGDALQRLLPAATARHLHVHSFALPSSDEYLERVIEALLIEPVIPFGMGSDSLKFLLTHYRNNDSTVTSFIRGFKMACMEHFFSQPLSFLCKKLLESLDQVQLEEYCDSLPAVVLKHASTLPSVQSGNFEGARGIGKDIALGLRKIKEHKENWSVALKCLLAACKLFGLDFLQALLEILQGKFSSSVLTNFEALGAMNSFVDGYEKRQLAHMSVIDSVLKKLRDSSEATVVRLLQKWVKIAGNLVEWRVKVEALIQKLASEVPSGSNIERSSSASDSSLRRKRLLSVADSGSADQDIVRMPCIEGSEAESSVQQNPSSGKVVMDTRLDHSSVNRSTTGQSSSLTKRSCPKALCKMASDLLEELLRVHKINLESLPFHEIVIFESVTVVRQALLVEPRKIIQRHIQDAGAILHCECCLSTISDSMNDSSILFCLAQKHGDEISWYDLYQEFETLLGSHGDPNNGKRRKNQKDSHLRDIDKASVQARFCKAASELQLVGIFRTSTKKRADFVHLTT